MNKTDKILEDMRQLREEKQALEKRIGQIEKQLSALNEKLPAIWIFAPTSRTYAKHGDIICAGSKQFCLDYMESLYPYGKMVNDSQYNDKDELVIEVLGVLKRITSHENAQFLERAQKWAKEYQDKQ